MICIRTRAGAPSPGLNGLAIRAATLCTELNRDTNHDITSVLCPLQDYHPVMAKFRAEKRTRARPITVKRLLFCKRCGRYDKIDFVHPSFQRHDCDEPLTPYEVMKYEERLLMLRKFRDTITEATRPLGLDLQGSKDLVDNLAKNREDFNSRRRR